MEITNLWGEDFKPVDAGKEARDVLKRISKKKQAISQMSAEEAVSSKSVPLKEKLAIIRDNVMRILGVYANNTVVIKTKDDFVRYIDKSIENGVIAVDTETNNSLDPLTCKLMGLCIYTKGMKNAYIPVNHVDVDTGERLSWQLTEEDIREQLTRLSNTKIIMHNGSFDYSVIKCTCGTELEVYWDTMICARLLDENERASLKQQYILKIDPTIEKYDIEHLFDIEYAVVPPEVFALYAATDAYMTFRLYEWQDAQLALPENSDQMFVFRNIEMPVVKITAEMELAGVSIDTEYAKNLSEYYHKQYDELVLELNEELENYRPQIEEWRKSDDATFQPKQYAKEEEQKQMDPKKFAEKYPMKDANGYYKLGKSKSEKLKDPVNVDSPIQLSILLYDVLKIPEGIGQEKGKGNGRGTGEDVLVAIDEKYHIKLCKMILDNRGFLKLINTYIDKIPQCVSPVDGRVHTHFNQMGADTGRFSSSDPINLQNIPSHNHTIRAIFRAKEGYTLVGSDYSAQEPRFLAALSGDPSMKEAYLSGKDLYAVVASMAFSNNYEDNLEYKDGVLQPDGKERRSQAKTILLGLMYGRGSGSIAEQIGCSRDDAQVIIDKFYNGFPHVKRWIDDTYSFSRKYGYVKDFWGRRRRLPDILLPKYQIYIDGKKDDGDFNPLIGARGLVHKQKNPLIEKYEKLLGDTKFNKQRDQIKQDAAKEGVKIIDNGGFISRAERQCVNARVQGSSASLTKLAMIKIANDPVLKEYDAKLIIGVHDELLIECKEEFAKEAGERLSYDMIMASKDNGVEIPMKCDAEAFRWWYQDQIIGDMKKALKKSIDGGESENDAEEKVKEQFYFLTDEQKSIIYPEVFSKEVA